MGKFRLEITDLAKKQIAKHIKSGNQTSIKKIEKILVDVVSAMGHYSDK
jgi:toxin YoeB